ncbi:MAG: hypothetical protein LBM93_07265 [Oscillospiraceae bacterium]|jgi:hypothetical protein|nr:hypothetical protein [Oscillospiraceae bacterium]
MNTVWKIVILVLIACIILWALSFLFSVLLAVLKIAVVVFLIALVIAGIKQLMGGDKKDKF